MRKSKQEAAQTRESIVNAASAEFRRNGINGTSLSDLMEVAGLTHGGFYRHFQSKDQLIAEACGSAIDSLAKMFTAAVSHHGTRSGLEALAASYLSAGHRDNRSGGCPFAGLGSELVRSDDKTRAVATEGLLKIVGLVAHQLSDIQSDIAKRRALVAFSTMIGALTLARMVTDPELSGILLQEAAQRVGAA